VLPKKGEVSVGETVLSKVTVEGVIRTQRGFPLSRE